MADHVRTLPVISSAALAADSHAIFARYRPSYPFVALDTGGYVVLRYDDVARLLSDPGLQATGTAVPVQAGIAEGALYDIFDHGMLTANGEQHGDRRAGVSRALAHETLSQFREHLAKAARAVIARCRNAGRLELVSEYAEKLPVIALASLLQLPEQDLSRFFDDIYKMNAFFRPNPSEGAVAEAEAAGFRLRAYLDQRLTAASIGHSDSFLSRYMRNAEQDGLTRIETLIQLIQLIIGGTESVRTALVAQAVQLLSHPAAWKAVCADKTLVASAVSESLRLEPGIAGVVRVSVQDIELDGWTLPAGQLVILSFLSALRDERTFNQPHVFDLARPNLHLARLAFGGGAHKCVAEAMGRAELEEGLAALVECLPDLQLDSRPAFQGHMFVRDTSECWVTCRH